MSSKLTALQRELMTAAARREDRLLTVPPNLRGAALAKAAATLVATGLVKEIKAKAGAPAWREDAATGQSHALKLMAAGLKTLAVAEQDEDKTADSERIPERGERKGPRVPPSRSKVSERAPIAPENDGANESQPGTDRAPARVPRAGSKLDQILEMMSSKDGATIDDLTSATNWLPHTARAALTGLRKRGYDIQLERADKQSPSVYRIGASSNETVTK
jgi:Protein of unknown function (DUF3489)